MSYYVCARRQVALTFSHVNWHVRLI